MKKYKIYIVSILLIILSILSLFFGLISVAFPFRNYATAYEGLYYSLSRIWRFFLFLPITIASIIFGLNYRKKGYKVITNIVIGVIFSFLLIGFGSMHFLGLRNYSRDISYLREIENKVGFTFPSQANILTSDWTKGIQKSYDDNYYKYESVVRFTDEEEISELVKQLSTSTIWINELDNNMINFISQLYYIETKNYDFFMLYCIETGEYNIVNNEANLNYIYMAYNVEEKVLLIKEFTKKWNKDILCRKRGFVIMVMKAFLERDG